MNSVNTLLKRFSTSWRKILQIRPKSPIQLFKHARGRSLLCALVLSCVLPNFAHADSIMGNHVVQSALESSSARAPGETAADATASSEFTQLLQDLSPLPVLALGLLGLIWIRRHTAEL